MSTDPKITDYVLYGPHYGDRLCMEQHRCEAFIWNDDWLVVADQLGQFSGREIKHVAVQFSRRPARERYYGESHLEVPARAKEFEDAA